MVGEECRKRQSVRSNICGLWGGGEERRQNMRTNICGPINALPL